MIIESKYLKAAALTAAGPKELRYYLQGVLLEVHKGHAIIASSDGHRCTVIRQSIEPESFPEGKHIIPMDIIKSIKASSVEFSKGPRKNDLKMKQGATSIDFKHIDGTFPDFRRVLPSKQTSGVAAWYKVAYLVDAGKALKLLGYSKDISDYPYIYQNGVDAGVVRCPDENVTIVIMPVREPESNTHKIPLSKYAV